MGTHILLQEAGRLFHLRLLPSQAHAHGGHTTSRSCPECICVRSEKEVGEGEDEELALIGAHVEMMFIEYVLEECMW